MAAISLLAEGWNPYCGLAYGTLWVWPLSTLLVSISLFSSFVLSSSRTPHLKVEHLPQSSLWFFSLLAFSLFMSPIKHLSQFVIICISCWIDLLKLRWGFCMCVHERPWSVMFFPPFSIVPSGMWDLSSLTRDCIGSVSLNHWIAREAPVFFL